MPMGTHNPTFSLPVATHASSTGTLLLQQLVVLWQVDLGNAASAFLFGGLSLCWLFSE